MPKKPKTQELATAFLSSTLEYEGALIDASEDILFHEGEQAFYFYDNRSGSYQIIPVGDKDTGKQAKMFSKFIMSNFPDVDANSNTIKELRAGVVRVIENVFSDDLFDDHPYTAFADGIFDWSTFKLLPHDKRTVALHSFDFDYPQPTQVIHTPVFDAYLKRVFKDDEEMIAFIPEMFGYYLLPKTKEPAAFYVYGPARSGKSVMLDLVRLLIGDRYACSFSLQSLTSDKYTVAELAGKRINIQDEDESEFILSDKFKALISQAKVQAERKYGAPFSFRPRCKFLFGSNQLPNFKSVDDGLLRRLRFIEFKHPLDPKEQDKNILEKLRKELPGIVQRSIAAAKAFVERQEEFNLPQSEIRTAEQFSIESEPAMTFFHETYYVRTDARRDEVPSDGWTLFKDMYKQYRDWCKENGKYPKSAIKFAKILDRIPGLDPSHTRAGNWRPCSPLTSTPTNKPPLF